MDINDTINPYNVFIDIRHTGDYPYSDLYLFITATGPDMAPMRDTVDCLLADADGRWTARVRASSSRTASKRRCSTS